MKRMTVILMSAVLASGLALAGCGGGGAKSSTTTKQTTTTTTMGQELQDLNKAYEDGLITDSQYESAKEDILERYQE
ncbi:MAG: hypothetical protein AAF495_10355 [Pseudomonadota bacterium]